MFDQQVKNFKYVERVYKTKLFLFEDSLYEPHVYVLVNEKTGIKYIGSRTAFSNVKARLTDLGNVYFSSCKSIKSNWTDWKVLHIFPCSSNLEAIQLEDYLIDCNDAIWSSEFLNRSRAGKDFNTSGARWSHTDTTKQILREKNLGRKFTEAEKLKCKKTEEQKAKISKTLTGRKLSEETKKKMADARRAYHASKMVP